MRQLQIGDVELIIQPEEEYDHYTDKAFSYEPETVACFDEMVMKHGLWGWCCVCVKVIWRGIAGQAYLGGCSYENEDNFREDAETLDGLVIDALADLNTKVKELLLEADEMRSELSLTFEEAKKRCEMYKQLRWTGRITCPHCEADLRDHHNGIPYKRSIGMYSREQDRTTHWKCPDCEGTWDRNDR
jgi:hypothetical protein